MNDMSSFEGSFDEMTKSIEWIMFEHILDQEFAELV